MSLDSMIRFCSRCGSSRIERKIPEGDTIQRLVCENCGNIHYINPRIIVGCLVIDEGKVLLCRRAIDPCFGKWNIPAGFMESDESAEEGARRETLEESGADVEIIRLHCVYSIPQVDQVYLIFLARLRNKDFAVGTESSEVQLFNEADIPWDEMAFTSNVFAMEKYFQNRNNPNPETYLGRHTQNHRF